MLRLTGAAGVAPFLAACAGAPPAQETEPGTFTVYWNAGHDYEAYRKVFEAFEKAHKVTVNVQKYQWEDMRTRLLADFSAGTVPDLVEEPGNWPQEFAASGNAMSLQKFVDKDGGAMGFPDDWRPASVEDHTFEGEVYGIQLHFTCEVLIYNKAMFADAGVAPPETWDDLLDVAKRLTKDRFHGIALNQDHQYASVWLMQNGVSAFDPGSGKVFTPRDAAIEAMQFQADLVHKHKVSPVPVAGSDPSGPQKLFSAKRTAMIITGPWDLGPIRKSSPDIEFGVAPLPKRKRDVTLAAGTSLFIPAKATRPEMSWDLIKRLTALDVEKAVTKEVGQLMPRKSWATSAEAQADEVTKVFARELEKAEEFTGGVAPTGKLGEFDELRKKMYQNIVIRNRPAAEVVPAFAKTAEKALKG